MAEQRGLMTLRGKIGKFRFVQSKEGYNAVLAEGINGDRVRNDPSYARTRENMAEFGRAIGYGKLVRNAFRSILKISKDRRLGGRLTRILMQAIKADMTHPRGLRNITEGEVRLLNRLEFNANAPLEKTYNGTFTTEVNRVTGEVRIRIPDFISKEGIAAPEGTTHFQILSGAAALDFEGGQYVADVKRSTEMIWNDSNTGAIELVHQVGPNSPYPVMVVLGFAFYIQSAGSYFPLQSFAFNTLTVVAVDAS